MPRWRYRIWPGRVLSTGASIPWELEYVTFPACRCVDQPGKVLWTPEFGDFYESFIMKAGQGKRGCGAETYKFLIMTWSFLWPAPIQEPYKSCLIKTKDTSVTQGIARNLGSLCHILLSLMELQRSWGFSMRSLGVRPNTRTEICPSTLVY